MKPALHLPIAQISTFCQKWGIIRLELFGSILRDDFNAESDVDFMAVWGNDAVFNLMDLVNAEEELAAICGRPVDLVSREAVEQTPNWLLRDYMMKNVLEIYAA